MWGKQLKTQEQIWARFFVFFFLSWILSAILEIFFKTYLFLRYYFGMPVQKSNLTSRFCASAVATLVWGWFHQLGSAECVHADFTVWLRLRWNFWIKIFCKCSPRICPVGKGYPQRFLQLMGTAWPYNWFLFLPWEELWAVLPKASC